MQSEECARPIAESECGRSCRSEIVGLFADPVRKCGAILEEVARMSVRLDFQSALEAEVTDCLNRYSIVSPASA